MLLHVKICPCAISGPAEWRLKSCIDNECSLVSWSWVALVEQYDSVHSSAQLEKSKRIPSHNVRAKRRQKRDGIPEKNLQTADRPAERRCPFISQWIEGSRTDKKDTTHLGPTDNTCSTRCVKSRKEKKKAAAVLILREEGERRPMRIPA